ncbi:MAG: VWA domain-containing protein, partial [Bacteroidota bacterium]
INVTFRGMRLKVLDGIAHKMPPVVATAREMINLPPPQNLGSAGGAQDGTDMVFVVDVSKTMDAVDLAPSRLNAAKASVSSFARRRSTDRIGIVGFGGTAQVAAPVSADLSATLKAVEGLGRDPNMAGTSVTRGMLEAYELLRVSDHPHKAIVLLTDGADNKMHLHPQTLAEIARRQGIRIHVIATGDTKPTHYVIEQDILGKMHRFEIPLSTRPDERILKALCLPTGGLYRHARNEIDLEKALREIAQFE